jgi:uncharacterized protein
MSISMYRASIPVLVRGLQVLDSLLHKGAGQAKQKGMTDQELIEARLSPDMFTLAGQVQFATDTARLSGERLSGVEAPHFEANETTFEQLHGRIARSIAWLEALDPAKFEESATRTVTIKVDGQPKDFRGDDYLLMFGYQNFLFHVTTAYDILRHKGIEIGKADFLGRYS